jgi:hypothetical protein
MSVRLRLLRGWQWTGPEAAAFAGFAPAFAAYLVPAAVYEAIVQERSHVAGNERFLLLATLALLAFLFGARLRTRRAAARPGQPASESLLPQARNAAVVLAPLGGLLFLAVALLVVAELGLGTVLGVLLRDQPSTVLRFGYGRVVDDRQLGFAVNAFRMAAPLVILASMGGALDNPLTRAGRGLYWAGLAAIVVLSQSREVFFTLLLSAAITFSLTRHHAYRPSLRTKAILAAAFLAFVGYAVAVQESRFEPGAEPSTAETLLGYTVASFNRAAALMDGTLRLPEAWPGYYWTRLAWEVPLVGPVAEAAANDLFASEDPPTTSAELVPHLQDAGLRPRYNVLSGLGQSWLDFGFLTWVPFLLVGAWMGNAWGRARNGSSGALVVYCALAFAMVDLVGHLRFSDQTVLSAVVLAAALRVLRPARRPFVRAVEAAP